jgi:hypothetical protein
MLSREVSGQHSGIVPNQRSQPAHGFGKLEIGHVEGASPHPIPEAEPGAGQAGAIRPSGGKGGELTDERRHHHAGERGTGDPLAG